MLVKNLVLYISSTSPTITKSEAIFSNESFAESILSPKLSNRKKITIAAITLKITDTFIINSAEETLPFRGGRNRPHSFF
jgi:hypothetical protein